MAETHGDPWRVTMKRRLALVAAAAMLWSGAIQGRLIYLQIVQHSELTAYASRQQLHQREVPAKRGDILDRHGNVLAYSVVAETIIADPTKIEKPSATVASLCAVLGCDAGERRALETRLSNRRRAHEYVRRRVPPDLAGKVAALGLQGIRFEKEDRRYYPNKELAAHVLGYVGVDHIGLEGLEATYDDVIKGEKGRMRFQTDANGTEFNSRVEHPPTVGATLELTLDKTLQHVLERELREGVRENRAETGTALVLDPWSGEILAMASYPTFNPNAFTESSALARRNRAIQDIYEPGSTFKIVAASAALEQGAVRPGDMIEVAPGYISFGANNIVRDIQNYRRLTFADVIVKSSNVGMIKVTSRVGPDRLTEYVRRFGFGRAASPQDFPGESPGIVWEAPKLTDSSLARVSIGYQISVTPLQMAAAMSSIANGGELIQPRVLRAVIRDGERHAVGRTVVNRTVTSRVAAELTKMMEGVVERGTATAAAISGYGVAGKTGTATKWANGGYIRTEHNASFVGFVPSRNPVYTILVVIDTPRGPNGYYGGPVAAPIFRRIAEASLRHGAVPRTFDAPPPLTVRRRSGSSHQRQVSLPLLERSPGTPGRSPSAPAAVVPDLSGLTARDALATLLRNHLGSRMYGSGLVVRQQPPAGSPAETGGFVSLWLERRTVEGQSSRLGSARTP